MNKRDKIELTQFAHVYLFCWSKGLYNITFERKSPVLQQMLRKEVSLEHSKLIDEYFESIALPQIKKILPTDQLLVDYFFNYCNVLIKTKKEGKKILQTIETRREEYVWNNLSKTYSKQEKDEFYTVLLANIYRFTN